MSVNVYRIALVSVAFYTVASLLVGPKAVAAEVSFKRVEDSIPAALVDHGDYYLHPNGERIEFFRKEGVFALRKRSGLAPNKFISSKDRIKAKYGSQVDLLTTKNLGNIDVVKLNPKSSKKGVSSVTPEMVKSLDSDIIQLDPVLANSRGRGDIILSSSIMFQLNDTLGQPQVMVDGLLEEYNLELIRKVNGPGNMYSVSVLAALNTSEQFNLVRRIANDSRVKWAQPQFRSRGYKMSSYQPNDALLAEQWNLRNSGKRGSRCDADCDANNAWGIDTGGAAVSGTGTIIAVIDDGVQLNHEDLDIWVNPGETAGNGLDDDGNGYIDDVSGWDFVHDDASEPGSCGQDGNPPPPGSSYTSGPDSNPNPQPFTACITPNGDDVEQDNHGTAVAGIAAAKGDNGIGVTGTAYSAQILPIRLISAFDANPDDDFCARVVEAMTYAGTYADVINNSWGMDEGTCPALDTVIESIVDGSLADLNATVVPRRDGKGTPVIFAAGNNASGWVKVTADVEEGAHTYEWRFLRTAFPASYEPSPSYTFSEDNSAWLDDITWPDGSSEGFESGLTDFESGLTLNSCDAICTEFDLPARPAWSIESNLGHVYSGNQSALINASNSDCGNVYLQSLRNGPAGKVSFWVWVSTNTENGSDKFEFLIDGIEITSFGDLPSIVDNQVAYPASLSKVIAVGASGSGDLSGVTTANVLFEERTSYSQYGASLDILAPSSDQHLAVITTDRYGPNGEGYNSSRDIGGATSAAPDLGYTDDFGGTSAAAPLVAGIAATMVAADGNITALNIESVLRSTADKIGRHGSAAYDQNGNTFSEFYGYGRVNMFEALKSVLGESDADTVSCAAEPFDYTEANDFILPSYQPLAGQFCPAEGPLLNIEELCVPIVAKNGSIAVICL